MLKTLIIYESRYGFTEEIARNLSLVLGPAFCCRASQFKGNLEEYDYIVICTPIYSESVDPEISDYVSLNLDNIQKKKVILLCTCLYENADQYLKSLRNQLGDSVVLSAAIGSELIIDRLSDADHKKLKQFCEKTGFPLKDVRNFNKEKFITLALEIKKIKDQSYRNVIEEKDIDKSIDDFIKNHNTCALATGYGETVRATPIEYTYVNGFIYLLSEGGEKFANLILNKNVSLCIYDEYKGMNELAGMQISGEAELIGIGNDEYISVIQRKGLDSNKISSMSISLNMIKITIKKIEFLWSEFAKMGYDIKQVVTN